MKNIFLLIITLLVFPYAFNENRLQAAEPEAIQYLMNEPASLFDIEPQYFRNLTFRFAA